MRVFLVVWAKQMENHDKNDSTVNMNEEYSS